MSSCVDECSLGRGGLDRRGSAKEGPNVRRISFIAIPSVVLRSRSLRRAQRSLSCLAFSPDSPGARPERASVGEGVMRRPGAGAVAIFRFHERDEISYLPSPVLPRSTSPSSTLPAVTPSFRRIVLTGFLLSRFVSFRPSVPVYVCDQEQEGEEGPDRTQGDRGSLRARTGRFPRTRRTRSWRRSVHLFPSPSVI